MRLTVRELSVVEQAIREALWNSVELAHPTAFSARFGTTRTEAEKLLRRTRQACRGREADDVPPQIASLSNHDGRVLREALEFAVNDAWAASPNDVATASPRAREEARQVLRHLAEGLGQAI